MLRWLPDAARLTGYPVLLVPGWEDRGHGGMRAAEVVMGHHTATAATATGDYPSLRVVRDGRADLPGPLAHLGLARSGAVLVIASGLCYHAGVSAYGEFTDLNDEAIGIEAESPGDGTWTAAQLDCYPRLVAALLHYMRRGPERYCSHRTAALPKGRKPDPKGISDDWMQGRAGLYLSNVASISRHYTPTPPAQTPNTANAAPAASPTPIGAPDMIVTYTPEGSTDWRQNHVAILVGPRVVDITTDEPARDGVQANIDAGTVIPVPLNQASWTQLTRAPGA